MGRSTRRGIGRALGAVLLGALSLGGHQHSAAGEPGLAVATAADGASVIEPIGTFAMPTAQAPGFDHAAPSAPAAPPFNAYASTLAGLAPQVEGLAPRVYVPNELANSVSVIDPATFKVIRTINVGSHPQHVAPDWDLGRLYVNDTGLTEIDARTGAVVRTVSVAMPYNLYFTPGGARAIVVAEDLKRLDFYDRLSWRLIGSVPIPWAGVDHLDFSADGGFLLATTEYTGKVVKVDLGTLSVAGTLDVGGLPIDVRLAPAGDVFYVTNQGRGGVSIVDGSALREVGFITTGRGAHGLAISRDLASLYVSNRLAGTISVIDFATRRVVDNWAVGGSPDMLQVSTDGSQLWTGNRSASTVNVIDTRTGKALASIAVGRAPHGLTYFPQPGRISLGHNGVYR